MQNSSFVLGKGVCLQLSTSCPPSECSLKSLICKLNFVPFFSFSSLVIPALSHFIICQIRLFFFFFFRTKQASYLLRGFSFNNSLIEMIALQVLLCVCHVRGSFGLIAWPLFILLLAHITGAASPRGGGSSVPRIVHICRGFPFVASVMGPVPCFFSFSWCQCLQGTLFSVLAGLD